MRALSHSQGLSLLAIMAEIATWEPWVWFYTRMSHPRVDILHESVYWRCVERTVLHTPPILQRLGKPVGPQPLRLRPYGTTLSGHAHDKNALMHFNLSLVKAEQI